MTDTNSTSKNSALESSLQKIRTQLQPSIAKASAVMSRLSGREIGLVAIAALAVVVIAGWTVAESVLESFNQQSIRIASLEESLKLLPSRIETYARNKAKRDAIEEQYKGIEIKEGARSYLESLVRDRAGVATGFTIKDASGGSFGKDYEQTIYTVKFTTANLQGLVDFLRELSFGKNPLIVGRLKIDMSARNDTLQVEIDVSSIKPRTQA